MRLGFLKDRGGNVAVMHDLIRVPSAFRFRGATRPLPRLGSSWQLGAGGLVRKVLDPPGPFAAAQARPDDRDFHIA